MVYFDYVHRSCSSLYETSQQKPLTQAGMLEDDYF